MSKFASQAARTVLKNFAKKALPTNVPPPANEADKELVAGMTQPGVLEQSTLLSGLFEKLGDTGVEPADLLSNPKELESILDLFPKIRPLLPEELKEKLEDVLSIPLEDILSIPIEFESIVDLLSKIRPLPLDEPDVDIAIRLCDPVQLERLTEGMEAELRRTCFLGAGYYEFAKTIDGWDEFADQAYLSTDNDSRDMGLTNGDAYGLCLRMQEMGIVGNTPAMVGVYQTIAQLALMSRKGQSPIVRIEGEHGSGKGAIAKALHDLGGRTGKFRRMNISAHSDELILSELYGHGKGAFTGAKQDRKGWFEKCSKNGTLVLDDLNHMNPDHQSKLLHALEERKISKIGNDKPIDVSGTMVIVTSNEDLAQKDAFQADLLERISTHVFKIPELIFRVTDVANLTRHFMDQQPLSNEISPFRFQIAWKLRKWAQEGILTVRALRNEIEHLTQDSQNISAIIENRDPYEQKILAAIEELYPNGEKPVKARVAEKLVITRSHLSYKETLWWKAWKNLEERGEIPGWRSN